MPRRLMATVNKIFSAVHQDCDNVGAASGGVSKQSRGPGGWGMTLFFVGKVLFMDFLISNLGNSAQVAARFTSFLIEVVRMVGLPLVKQQLLACVMRGVANGMADAEGHVK
jgi:hypothetical protein